jgi:hypothetical protein
MININDIIDAIAAGQVVASRHSLNEAAQDNLVISEIYLSVMERG